MKKLSQDELFIVCKIQSKDLHNIVITDHADERMELRDITYNDILSVLTDPKKLVSADFNQKYNNYGYRIHGKDDTKHIVIAIDPKTWEIIIVTVINTLYDY